jgi:hypothetical protein
VNEETATHAMQLHREPMGSVGFFFTSSKLMGVSILFSVAKLMIIATPVLSICKSSIILPLLMLCQDEFTIVYCHWRTIFLWVWIPITYCHKRTFAGVNFNYLLSLKNTCGCEFQWLIVIEEHLQVWISIIYHNIRTFASVDFNYLS